MQIAIGVLFLALIATWIVLGLRIGTLTYLAADHDKCIRKLTSRIEALEKDKTDLRSFRDDITTMGKRIELLDEPVDVSPLTARVFGLEDGLARHVSASQFAADAIQVVILKHTDQIAGLQNWCGQLEKADESTTASLTAHATNAVSSMLYRLATTVKDKPRA